MATIASTRPTMLDLAQVSHNGEIMDIVWPLTEAQDILKDPPWYEANDISTHRISRNLKLVSGVWRQINKGFSAAKGTQDPAREEIGGIESRLEVDLKELKMAPNREKFLETQEMSHYEGLSQDFADAIVRGSRATDAASFNGFETRYDSLSDTDPKGREICYSYTGTGSDLTSILAVQWGPGQVYMTYPRGEENTLGINRIVIGRDRVTDRDSNAFYAYVITYEWNGGLVVEDERCFRRICNIESSGSADNLLDSDHDLNHVIDAILSMKNMGKGVTLYMNRETYGQLWKASSDKVNVNMKPNNPWKSPEYYFDMHPVRFTDSLLNTESAVS